LLPCPTDWIPQAWCWQRRPSEAWYCHSFCSMEFSPTALRW
jgi:hypothetical protein